MREIDPNLPVYETRTLERQVAQSVSRERLVSAMTAPFGTLATLLAVVGLDGVMSYPGSQSLSKVCRSRQRLMTGQSLLQSTIQSCDRFDTWRILSI